MERPPEVDSNTAAALIAKLFPFKHVSLESLKPLPSYYDRNIYFEGVRESRESADGSSDRQGSMGEAYVLKVSSSCITAVVIEGINSQMLFLSSKGFPCCHPIASRSGEYTGLVSKSELLGDDARQKDARSNVDVKYPVRALKYIAGEIMDKLDQRLLSQDLIYSVGRMAGRMDLLLEDFQHPAIEERIEVWDLQHFANVKEYIPHLQDEKKREMANTVMAMFEANVLPAIPSWKKGVIHNDVSGQNIVLKEAGGEYEIVGLLDFGECAHTCYLFELAAMLAYAKLERENPVEFVVPMLRGYLDAFPLSKDELGCLYYAVLARMCQSAVSGEYRFLQEPWNSYLLTTPAKAWTVIDLLLTLTKDRVEEIWGVWKKE